MVRICDDGVCDGCWGGDGVVVMSGRTTRTWRGVRRIIYLCFDAMMRDRTGNISASWLLKS